MHEVVLYDMTWAGLRHRLKTKVTPWISTGKDGIDTLDQLFDCVVASEFEPDYKMPGRQQQESQYRESQKTGEKKCNFRPAISKSAESTSPNSNNCTNPDTGHSQSVKSNKPSGGSRAHYKQRRSIQRKSTKPKGKPATHLLWQRRPQNLLCNKYTWQHAASQSTN
jgi:hypothetical protein